MHLLVQQGQSEGVRVVTGHWSWWERERFEIRRGKWATGNETEVHPSYPCRHDGGRDRAAPPPHIHCGREILLRFRVHRGTLRAGWLALAGLGAASGFWLWLWRCSLPSLPSSTEVIRERVR